jgi:hypothetical protein
MVLNSPTDPHVLGRINSNAVLAKEQGIVGRADVRLTKEMDVERLEEDAFLGDINMSRRKQIFRD